MKSKKLYSVAAHNRMRYIRNYGYNPSGHRGFYLPDGSHVYGDPDMSEETKNALMQMIECAKKARIQTTR
jgi:hypothetical protein